MGVSVRVLDSTGGRPVRDLAVALYGRERGDWARVAGACTDSDGRIGSFVPHPLPRGVYRLVFATGDYFRDQGAEALYPEIIVSVRYPGVSDLHIPLFLSPFSYSTHRGSPEDD
ncbi:MULTISPECIES: hydroxyisourate hydrolase [unclassified Streptomyces]|uniref:hydroxyisourate hydrolase n=1 Tax=unclassified Streptomyces TaxID=2593676 RepID=UPI00332EDB12